MELRARIQPLPRRTAMMAACAALLVTALAATIAPSAAHASKAPVVTKVAPLDVAVIVLQSNIATVGPAAVSREQKIRVAGKGFFADKAT